MAFATATNAAPRSCISETVERDRLRDITAMEAQYATAGAPVREARATPSLVASQSLGRPAVLGAWAARYPATTAEFAMPVMITRPPNAATAFSVATAALDTARSALERI